MLKDWRQFSPHARFAGKAVALSICVIAITILTGLVFHKPLLAQQGVFCLSPVLVMFLYLARAGSPLRALLRKPSPAALGWTVVGVLFTVVASRYWCSFAMCVSTLASLFFIIDPRRLYQRIRTHIYSELPIALGALSGPFVLITQKFLWVSMAKLTAHTVALLLSPFYDTLHVASRDQILSRAPEYVDLLHKLAALGVKVQRTQQNFVILLGDSTIMKFFYTMNILNGFGLFLFLLSLLVLVQQQLFRNLSLLRIYAFGMVSVFLGNVLWLSAMHLLLPAQNTTGASLPYTLRNTMPLALPSWGGYLLLDLGCVVLVWFLAQHSARGKSALFSA
jgi:hypothetical protein